MGTSQTYNEQVNPKYCELNVELQKLIIYQKLIKQNLTELCHAKMKITQSLQMTKRMRHPHFTDEQTGSEHEILNARTYKNIKK